MPTADPWTVAPDGGHVRVSPAAAGPVQTGFYPMPDADTVCVSVQAGCNIGCRFCLTGVHRSSGNLTAQEIVAQVLAVQPLRRNTFRLGVAFQGMGEPLLNYAAVHDAIVDIDASGIADTFRISTIGFPDRVDRLLRDLPFVKLQISLHSAIETQRRTLISGSAGSDLRRVIASGRRYAEVTGQPTVLNYVLLAGVNDRPENIEALVALLQAHPDRFRVKLSEYNPHSALPYLPTDPATEKWFLAELLAGGIDAFEFRSMATGVGGGCGHFNPRLGGAAQRATPEGVSDVRGA